MLLWYLGRGKEDSLVVSGNGATKYQQISLASYIPNSVIKCMCSLIIGKSIINRKQNQQRLTVCVSLLELMDNGMLERRKISHSPHTNSTSIHSAVLKLYCYVAP